MEAVNQSLPVSEFDINQLVIAYVAIRDERENAKAAFEKVDGELKEQLTALEQAMLGICNSMDVESIKTEHGLMMRQLKERFFCGDWEGFSDFVVANNAVGLLEKRIHQGNFKKYLEETPDSALPPGCAVSREYTIVVRRPTAK